MGQKLTAKRARGLTVERLREVLTYAPSTGRFTHKRRPETNAKDKSWNTRYAGKRAGYLHKPSGYWIISIDDVKYKSHRLAHLWMTGDWPPETVDHRFGNRADNRWTQLRPAAVKQNNLNKGLRSDNSSGCPGVNFDNKAGKWRAYITLRGVQRWLGYYATREDAIAQEGSR
jgi:hypothetical protein